MPLRFEKGAFDFDGTLKEMCERDGSSLVTIQDSRRTVTEFLNVELPRVQTRRADVVARLDDGSIAHVEFQSDNDSGIAYRQGIYCLALGEKYRCHVHQTVIYVGRGRMTMADGIQVGATSVSYRLMDIRSMDADALLSSGRQGDIAMALLASGGTRRLTQIIRRAAKLDVESRERVLGQLLVLSGLRGMPGEVEWEMKRMGVVIDVTKNPVLMRYLNEAAERAEAKGEARGRARMFQEILEARFGPLPKWAVQRIGRASLEQLEGWSPKLLKAETLTEVLGPR